METGWNLFNNTSSSGGGVKGQNGNCSNNPAWGGIWELSTSTTTNASRISSVYWSNLHRHHHHTIHNNNNNNSFNQETINFPSSSSSSSSSSAAGCAVSTQQHESAMHALVFSHQEEGPDNAYQSHVSSSSPSLMYAGRSGSCYHPDPHLTCLKLGKRHYFENINAATRLDNPPQNNEAAFSLTKRGKPYYQPSGGFGSGQSTPAAVTVAAVPPSPTVPKCQVEGCNALLVNAKDYHRRHKVCELHSKAPKVMVLGIEQRFCQQCSRFHAVSEFDDSKRSCRRRLAGHNERRRKSSQDHSAPRNQTQDDRLMAGRYPYLPPLNSGSALSLLSSKNDSWMSSGDLSARCSAALRELIAENRAAILARQLNILDRNGHWRPHPVEDHLNELQNQQSNSMEQMAHSWENNVNAAGTHLTLDLKQTPNSPSAFGYYLSVQPKSKEEECSELWGAAFKGTRVL